MEHPEATQVFKQAATGQVGQCAFGAGTKRPEPQVHGQAIGQARHHPVGGQQPDLAPASGHGQTAGKKAHPCSSEHLEWQPRADPTGDQRRGKQRQCPQHETEPLAKHPAGGDEQEKHQLETGHTR